jgi:hypothetical protein
MALKNGTRQRSKAHFSTQALSSAQTKSSLYQRQAPSLRLCLYVSEQGKNGHNGEQGRRRSVSTCCPKPQSDSFQNIQPSFFFSAARAAWADNADETESEETSHFRLSSFSLHSLYYTSYLYLCFWLYLACAHAHTLHNLLKGLFTSWTMKSSLSPPTYVTGHGTHLMTTLVYIKKEMLRVTMELEVLKMTLVLHYPFSWSNGFHNGRGKSDSLVANVKRPWQRNAQKKIPKTFPQLRGKKG